MIGSVFPPVESFFQPEPSLGIESYFECPIRTEGEFSRHIERPVKSTGITGTWKPQFPRATTLRSGLTPHWTFSQRERSLPAHKRSTRAAVPTAPHCSFFDLQRPSAPCKCLQSDVLYSSAGNQTCPNSGVWGRFPAHPASLQTSSSGCVFSRGILSSSRIQQFCQTLDDARKRIAAQHNLLVALRRDRQASRRIGEEAVDEEEASFDFNNIFKLPVTGVPSCDNNRKVVSLMRACAFLPSKMLRGAVSTFGSAEGVSLFIPWLLSLKEDMVFRKMRYRSALASCRAHITRLTQENNALRARVRSLNQMWGCDGSKRLVSNGSDETRPLLQQHDSAKMPPEAVLLSSEDASSVRYCTVSTGGALEYTAWERPTETQSSSLFSKTDPYFDRVQPVGSKVMTDPTQSSAYPKVLKFIHDDNSRIRKLSLDLNAVRCAIFTEFPLPASHYPATFQKHSCSLEHVVAVNRESKAGSQNFSRSVTQAACQSPIPTTELYDLDEFQKTTGQVVKKQVVAINTVTRKSTSERGVHGFKFVRDVVEVNWGSTFTPQQLNGNVESSETHYRTSPVTPTPKQHGYISRNHSSSAIIFAKGKTKSTKHISDNVQNLPRSEAVVIQVAENEKRIAPIKNQTTISAVSGGVSSTTTKMCITTQHGSVEFKGGLGKPLRFGEVRQDPRHKEDATTPTSYISHVGSKPLGAFQAPPSARVFRMVAGSVREVPSVPSDQSKLGNDHFLYGSLDISQNSGRSRIVQRRIQLAAMGKGTLILGENL